MTDTQTTPELLYLLAGDPAELREAVAGKAAADVAELLDGLNPIAAARVLGSLPLDLAVQILDEPELESRLEIFQALPSAVRTPLLDSMSSDQQASLLREMESVERSRLLRELDPETRKPIELILGHSAETAGGIMTTEFVAVPSTWTVEQALRHISSVGKTKETVYAVYAVDANDRLLHVVSLRELMGAERSRPLTRVGDRRTPLSVPPEMDREEVARLISKYNLLAVPVVDDDRRILGIVTVDDVIDAIVAEQTEDVQKLGGTAALGAPYLEVTLPQMVRKRAGWLAVLFLGEMLTASAMANYEDEIARAVVLALFVPLIISSGGNSGSQATTLVIRALAVGEITLRDWFRVARREIATGLALGAILGLIGLLRILVWQGLGFGYGEHFLKLGLTVSLSLVGVVLWGSLVGSMLPFLLRKLGFDPATASAPFVATLVDVTGLVIYFTLASLLLQGTLLGETLGPAIAPP
jgi:magnesium transporter